MPTSDYNRVFGSTKGQVDRPLVFLCVSRSFIFECFSVGKSIVCLCHVISDLLQSPTVLPHSIFINACQGRLF